ncbi:MAG: hypothetical protein BV457_03445 [Thermoplasmata archaeon M9B1D]|nr:MAG: hypothetical protein BV457_03445 [Thermoplasmata archaeon M9B1D]
MGNSLLDLEESGVSYGLEGLKIMIYGGNTLGKTPQAMRFPKPLLLMGESGGSALKGYKKLIKSKKVFIDTVKELTDDKNLDSMKDKFNTIVIDTIEDIIELFEIAICKQYGVSDVGEIQQLEKGNPNGYSVYRKEFKQQINLLTGCGYTVVFIAHEECVQIPTGENDKDGNAITKDFIQPKGSRGDKSSSRFIRDICDFRFFVMSNGIDKETNKTIMSKAYCVQTDAFYAGSRFNVKPVINPFTAENIIEAIEEAQKSSAEEYDAELVVYSRNTDNYTKEDYLVDIKPYMKKLYSLYPQLVLDIIENQLGSDKKVSDATEDQLTELETIYNNLVDLATERGIYVDTEE